jgi:predicted DCC family thiol-disulfide oxidoreductase YuxK
VQFVLSHERHDRWLRFASLQGEVGSDALRRHPELAEVDSMIWIEPAREGRGERVLVRSDAVLATARYLGGPWRALGALGRLVPRAVRDGAYRLVARHRYSIGGRVQACILPTPDQRRRFLDRGGGG